MIERDSGLLVLAFVLMTSSVICGACYWHSLPLSISADQGLPKQNSPSSKSLAGTKRLPDVDWTVSLRSLPKPEIPVEAVEKPVIAPRVNRPRVMLVGVAATAGGGTAFFTDSVAGANAPLLVVRLGDGLPSDPDMLLTRVEPNSVTLAKAGQEFKMDLDVTESPISVVSPNAADRKPASPESASPNTTTSRTGR